MPGIPFVLARCQGCSWTRMCSCMQGDPEDNMAGPFFTAEEQTICLYHVLKPNTKCDTCDILRNYHWRASTKIESHTKQIHDLSQYAILSDLILILSSKQVICFSVLSAKCLVISLH